MRDERDSLKSAPSGLSPEAKLVWERLSQDYPDLHDWSETDRAVLVRRCEAEVDLCNLRVLLRTDGYSVPTKDGGVKGRPEVAAFVALHREVRELDDSLRVSRAARQKMDAKQDREKGSAVREFLLGED